MKKLWKSIDLDIRVIVIFILGFLAICFLVTGIQTCRQVKKIEQTVDRKFDNIKLPVTVINKYDSASQNKMDSIERQRIATHSVIDRMFDSELQRLLDSLYNSR